MTLGDQARELQRIIDQQLVSTLFQPIVDCQSRTVLGYEVLSRGPSDSPLHGAPALFQAGEQCGQVIPLERACLIEAGQSCLRHGLDHLVFVNVSPGLLAPEAFTEDRLEAMLTAHGIQPDRIVIELSERYPIEDPARLRERLIALKQRGFLIAIDDLGTGYSGLKLWSEIQPDFVKIDRHFIRDVDRDLVKKEFVRSVINLCERLGCRLIAEGVETAAELSLLRSMGIHLIQGYLLGRPNPFPAANLDAMDESEVVRGNRDTSDAGYLGRFIEPLPPTATLGEAWHRLQASPSVFALPVVDGPRPLGLLHKWRVMEVFSTTYGRALNEKKPVLSLMSHDALVVEHDESLEAVSQSLLEDDLYYLKQHFIVTRDGNYMGLGSTRSLLKMLTRRRVEQARHANPLSQLPGNVMIQQEAELRLRRGEPFTCVYFDIDHFKPFNDLLGYSEGDAVILSLARQIGAVFDGDGDWVGHIGGDDFVVLCDQADVEARCRQVQALFVGDALGRYPEGVREARQITAQDRDGRERCFPLVSLSAGLIRASGERFASASELASRASMAKSGAKKAVDGLFWLGLCDGDELPARVTQEPAAQGMTAGGPQTARRWPAL
ncbi:bifunctional diguanylate cyclase/phosphodiesterase [Marinobacter bohaiensis]|uniref:bifunctional diguanylate cyclase/phosphodiesterase n=1 Tax=Marinobacter bohaiensis TaxID=2201898 RepID=UPI000DAC9C25|nr:bifunctional diguanylate cyclase/phosphodiesterase [Marinobacter bohaiensis]